MNEEMQKVINDIIVYGKGHMHNGVHLPITDVQGGNMQTRLQSFIEACLNIGSGFIIAFCLWSFVIVPYQGFESSFTNNLGITGAFTVVSIIRSYIWRRIFNWRHVRNVERLIRDHP